ncbi:MAG: DUF2214 domain-containing protein [Methyloceanibacter sp.]
MESFLAAIEATGSAQYLKDSRWGYAAVSGAHVLGIALLVGAALPIDLRLLGFWRTVPRADVLRLLVPVAGTGLALAAVSGLLLFSVRAQEYAEIGFFQAKLALIFVGVLSAAMIHRAYGLDLAGASRTRVTYHALISLACWLGALSCGRLIAFAME